VELLVVAAWSGVGRARVEVRKRRTGARSESWNCILTLVGIALN